MLCVAILKHILLGSAASFGALVLSLFVEPLEQPAPAGPTPERVAGEGPSALPTGALVAPTDADGSARERLAELLARRVLTLVGREPSAAARVFFDRLGDGSGSGT